MYDIMITLEEAKKILKEKNITGYVVVDLEFSGKYAKAIIESDISHGLPHGKYYVDGKEVTMNNINDFSLDQLEQSYQAVIEKDESVVDFDTFLKMKNSKFKLLR